MGDVVEEDQVREILRGLGKQDKNSLSFIQQQGCLDHVRSLSSGFKPNQEKYLGNLRFREPQLS